MKYYYDQNNFSELLSDTKKLKTKLIPEVTKIETELQNEFTKIHHYWTTKNTFGYIITNFEKKQKGRMIGAGEKALFFNLKDHYRYVILCNDLSSKFKKFDVDGNPGIQLNITQYKAIFQKAGNTKKIVNLFIQKPSPDELELEIIREFLKDPEKVKQVLDFDTITESIPLLSIDNPEQIKKILQLIIELSEKHNITENVDLQKILGMMIRFFQHYDFAKVEDFEEILSVLIEKLEKYELKSTRLGKLPKTMINLLKQQQITNAEELKELISLTSFSEESLLNNIKFLEDILKEFNKKIKSDVGELEIRDFIYNNMWIFDFKFMGYDKIIKEEETDVGDIDISMHKSQFGISSLVIAEFKKPSTDIITEKYRGKEKPAILAEVGKAISQTIHYMEINKKAYRSIEGIVIIGRKKEFKDFFLDVFNDYLHGIKIVTFDQLHDDASQYIETFKKLGKR